MARDASSLNGVIYSRIKNILIMNQIVPGQKLQCQDLASLLKVSRTPVQHALGILASEGFLDLIPNKGYYAKEITPKEVIELYEIREALELLSIKNAAGKIVPSHLKQLEAKKMAYENILREPFGRIRFIHDMDFHLTISEIGASQNLTSFLKQVLERVYFTYPIDMLSHKRGLEVVKEHDLIFNALKEKNIPEAMKGLKRHLKNGMEYLLSGFNRRAEILNSRIF